ncbi:MAG: polyphosphate:AMP phosphotransferase [Candidatus Binatia bacterium]
MFESAEIGSKVEKKTYAERVPVLREQLLAQQRRLANAPLSAIVVIGGVEGAGKSETLNLLHEWMDTRGLESHAVLPATDEERARPPMWRFWRVLPAKGHLGIFLGSWYTGPILASALGDENRADLDEHLDRILEFERMLVNEDTVLIKLWLHIEEKTQGRRLEKLATDPEQSWRVTKLDWRYFKHYKRFRGVSEHALARTSTAEAPWHVIEATDRRHRELTVGTIVMEALRERLDRIDAAPAPVLKPDLSVPKSISVLRALDLTKKLDDKTADRRLLRYMGEVARQTRRLDEEKRSLLLVFEGPDAAGKGGAIRRLTRAVDARRYRVTPFSAPTDEEAARPYLWRFWRNVPSQGRVAIFDRSWYGRVLVERVEGLCPEEDWRRAYAEINDFERELADFGVVLVKFWLWMSPEEQLRRFQDRHATAYKQYKLTEDDWRNRKRWDAYEAAACEMIERTSSAASPWTLVEADDKNWARVRVLETVAKKLGG